MLNYDSVMAIMVGMLIPAFLGLLALITISYRKAKPGQALLRNGVGGPRVTFSSILAFPILHRCEVMDISMKRIAIRRSGKDGLICKDNLRADIDIKFLLHVNKTREDVIKVAQLIGCERVAKQENLVELFEAKFTEALKTVGKRHDFAEHYENHERFRTEVMQLIGSDLHGFVLDEIAIESFDITPVNQLDPNHILDAEGIKKLADRRYGEDPKPEWVARAFREEEQR